MSTLAELAALFHLSLTQQQLDRFRRYRELLQIWNERFNLTAIRTTPEIELRHFLDALTCATVTGNLDGKRLIDVGTGAGFPGLPLKILYPDLQLTLVESTKKKARFLEAVVLELALAGVQILAERAETVGQQPEHREQYDWAVARAVAALPILVEYLLPLCRVGGHALTQKGESAGHETAAARRAIQLLGGGEAQLHPIQLPGRAETHYLVLIPKIAVTPSAYPRSPGRPAKQPLG
ncbi:MAG: 16S rRNA (guanine(527)-N(7))-methyltransferase RsmG [Anaerolineae bacterium]|nr:16S rRNA (guanine(527)-N(7))-methyltransferase RsmG [Anaerolineae bacterium]